MSQKSTELRKAAQAVIDDEWSVGISEDFGGHAQLAIDVCAEVEKREALLRGAAYVLERASVVPHPIGVYREGMTNLAREIREALK